MPFLFPVRAVDADYALKQVQDSAKLRFSEDKEVSGCFFAGKSVGHGRFQLNLILIHRAGAFIQCIFKVLPLKIYDHPAFF